MKKAILSIGTIGAVVIPMTAAISCADRKGTDKAPVEKKHKGDETAHVPTHTFNIDGKHESAALWGNKPEHNTWDGKNEQPDLWGSKDNGEPKDDGKRNLAAMWGGKYTPKTLLELWVREYQEHGIFVSGTNPFNIYRFDKEDIVEGTDIVLKGNKKYKREVESAILTMEADKNSNPLPIINMIKLILGNKDGDKFSNLVFRAYREAEIKKYDSSNKYLAETQLIHRNKIRALDKWLVEKEPALKGLKNKEGDSILFNRDILSVKGLKDITKLRAMILFVEKVKLHQVHSGGYGYPFLITGKNDLLFFKRNY